VKLKKLALKMVVSALNGKLASYNEEKENLR
jgi:hypothetical protein